MDSPPPRAFTQGVGTIFQFVGVSLFVVTMFICCGSGLLSKETATRPDLTRIGWHLPGDVSGKPTWSAQYAMTVSLVAGVFFGMALAGLGLGLQAENRRAPAGAVLVTFLATIFFAVHTIFAIQIMRSIVLTLLAGAMTLMFGALFGFALAAWREMRRNPPPPDHEILPADYKIPYSHLHQDPPEVRLQRELDQRRRKLAVEQKELEMLEEKLKRRSQP